ncbi:tetratricopeptide repeat protein [Trinickia acidisoli]|uniref:tetratricopeptide repeat protein n=1 Tax=Trinickia acidisoli TaxID=2767482 RepID=UPI001A8C033C|nr:tetratricopeptide repeat protein [Trinickia acidisoli]
MKAFASPLALRAAFASLALVFAGCTQTVLTSQSFAHPAFTHTVANAKAGGEIDDMSLAESALQSGDASLAASMFEKALEKHPHDVRALDGLGAALVLSGDLERARRSYDRALALAPDSIPSLIGLARLDLRERHLDDAIARYERVLEHDRSNALASAGLGSAFAIKGDERRARDIFGQALQLHPGDRMLTVDLGLAMVLDGELRKGANLLLTVAGEPSAPVQARHDLALAYGLLGNDGAADQILRRDLPRASTDDNLTYYKVVRARLEPSPRGVAPIATLPPDHRIGVRQISLSAAAPIAVPASSVRRGASNAAPADSEVALRLEREVPAIAPSVIAASPVVSQATSPAASLGEPPAEPNTAPDVQWQLHRQTPLLQLH